ncbi:MAG: DUF4134 family protein, partial [Bacteroidaceae bacterium]|nr:DUF4134 family protein [Bacteroidaceae bacterium]
IGANFKGYVEPVRNIVYALAAICAVIGAFTIYFKMTNGEQDVKKTIIVLLINVKKNQGNQLILFHQTP